MTDSRWLRWGLVGLLLGIALVLRLAWVELARFGGDEAQYWSEALRFVRGEGVPLLGEPVTGGPARLPGPLAYWAIAPPLWISPHPLATATWTAVGHVLAIGAFAAVAAQSRGARAGWVALAVAALAPWDILYSDRAWGSNVAPVWASFGLAAACVARRRPWAAALAFFFLATLPQHHLSAPVAWMAAAVWVGLGGLDRTEREESCEGWRAFRVPGAVAVAAVLLAYLPPAVHELTQPESNLALLSSRSGGSLRGMAAIGQGLKAIEYAVLFGSVEIGYHLHQGFWGGFDDVAVYGDPATWVRRVRDDGVFWTGVRVVSVAASLAAWVWASVRLLRGLGRVPKGGRAALDGTDRLTAGLWAALLFAALGIARSGKMFFPHYVNVLVPFALFPLVAAIDAGWGRLRAFRPVAVVGGLSFAVAGQLHLSTFYRVKDGLNGIGPTTCLVERALVQSPFRLRFTHFDNRWAWGKLAAHLYGRPLPVVRDRGPMVVVRNHRADWEHAACPPVRATGWPEPEAP